MADLSMEESVFDDYGDSEDFEPIAIVGLPSPFCESLRVFAEPLIQLH
jgi:hypothetical protein